MTVLLLSAAGIAGQMVSLIRISDELRGLRARIRLAELARTLPPDTVLQITQRDGGVWRINIPPQGPAARDAKRGRSR